MSSPFFDKRFTFTQPDGTTLDVVGSGNQHSAVFETLDGFTVVRDPATGYYEYANLAATGELRPSGVTAPQLDPGDMLGVQRKLRPSPEAARTMAREASRLPQGGNRWEQRRAAARLAQVRAAATGGLAPPQQQTVGAYVGLCLLVEFPDNVPGTITQGEVEQFCNRKGYAGFGNNGSVYDYFAHASGDRLQYTNLVTPYYTARRPRSYYTNRNVDQPIRARELVVEALTHWRDRGFDFSRLSVDGQACVYAVNVFYAGPRVNDWAEGLWPHQSHLAAPFDLGGGTFAHDYQITDMGNELTLGTFCHENGHMLCDFPDLYDTRGFKSAGAGVYCLMAAGGAESEKNPGQLGAYLKRAAGWGTTVQLTSGDHEARADANQFFMHGLNPTEYLLVENRARGGRDEVLPGSGLAIWHVDETGSNDNEQMTPQLHYECSLVQADGKRQLERGANRGDATDLFGGHGKTAFGHGSDPASRWWDGTATDLEISGISPPGATVRFRVDVASAPSPQLAFAPAPAASPAPFFTLRRPAPPLLAAATSDAAARTDDDDVSPQMAVPAAQVATYRWKLTGKLGVATGTIKAIGAAVPESTGVGGQPGTEYWFFDQRVATGAALSLEIELQSVHAPTAGFVVGVPAFVALVEPPATSVSVAPTGVVLACETPLTHAMKLGHAAIVFEVTASGAQPPPQWYWKPADRPNLFVTPQTESLLKPSLKVTMTPVASGDPGFPVAGAASGWKRSL